MLLTTCSLGLGSFVRQTQHLANTLNAKLKRQRTSLQNKASLFLLLWTNTIT